MMEKLKNFCRNILRHLLRNKNKFMNLHQALVNYKRKLKTDFKFLKALEITIVKDRKDSDKSKGKEMNSGETKEK